MNNKELKKTALLISLATALQLIEYLIPTVIPGLKPGLANIITLIVLFESSYFKALEVSLLRAFLTSLITGSFLSPGFFLSFSSAFSSTTIMALFFLINKSIKRKVFSITGISIIGAISHNLTQIFLARVLLIKNNGIFVFVPWLIMGALVTGWITAKIAFSCMKQIAEIEDAEEDNLNLKLDGHASLFEDNTKSGSLASAHIKIFSMIVFSISAFIIDSLPFLFLMFTFSFLFLICCKIKILSWLKHLKKLLIILISAASLPFIFAKSGDTCSAHISFFIFNIPEQPLTESLIYVTRITALLTFAYTVSTTTSPLLLARSFTVYFRFFSFLGIKPERCAALITMAWMLIPSLKAEVLKTIKNSPHKKYNAKHLFLIIRNIILSFYKNGEKQEKH